MRLPVLVLFLLLTLSLALFPQYSNAQVAQNVVITEVYYDTYVPYEPDEYVRIHNPTGASIDISGWEITDLEASTFFPPNTVIGSKQSLFIAKEAAAFNAETTLTADFEYGADSLPQVPQMTGGIPSFVNTKDEVILKNQDGSIVDVVIYGPSDYSGPAWTGVPVSDVTEGIILERDRDESTLQYLDSDSIADWDDNRIYTVGQSHFDYETFTFTGQLTLFTSPDSSFDVITSAIKNAKTSFYLNIYQFHSLELLPHVVDAAKRGLDVKIYIEGGPVGVSAEGQELARYVAQQIVQAGGEVRYIITDDAQGVHDRYRWDHAKYSVIDNETVIVESENWKTTGIPVRSTGGNRGWGALIVNKDVAGYFLKVFSDDWKLSSKDVIRHCDPSFPKYCDPASTFSIAEAQAGISYPSDSYKVHFRNQTINGTFKVSPVFAPDTSLLETKSILGMIKDATKSVYVQQIYIHKHWGGTQEYWNSTTIPEEDQNIYLEEVIDAARRGLEVRVLLGHPFGTDDARNNIETAQYVNAIAQSENLNMIAKLVDRSVSTGTGFTKIHNKGVIVDGNKVLVSSINWGKNSPMNNREAAVIIEDTVVGTFFTNVFNFDWNPSDLTSPDIDQDGTPDFSDIDADGDGISNKDEIANGSNPFNSQDPTPTPAPEPEPSPTPSPTPSTSVLLTEVYYDTVGTDSKEEFIELFNPTSNDIDISGWTLNDDRGTYTIPAGTIIRANSTLTIARDAAGFRNLFGSSPDISGLTLSLSNSGDQVSLKDRDGVEIDLVAYENSVAGWDITASTGQSIQRVGTEDTNSVSDWTVNDPNPGTPLWVWLALAAAVAAAGGGATYVKRKGKGGGGGGGKKK